MGDKSNLVDDASHRESVMMLNKSIKKRFAQINFRFGVPLAQKNVFLQ